MLEKNLANGLKLIKVPLKNTKTTTVLVLLPVGSRYEGPELYGASHFIEHLMFKGTKKRPNNLKIARVLDAIGAQFNAFTSKDHTGYWIKSAADKVETSFDLLSDMLFHSLFHSKDFQQEKGVIVEEIKMYQENPLFYIEDFFEQTLYNGHSLGRTISGRSTDVRKMKLSKLLNYKNKFYQPGQMVVAVAGQIDQKQINSLVKKYFFPQESQKKKQNQYSAFSAPSNPKTKVKILRRKINQAQIALGGLGCAYHDQRLEALMLLLIILGGNMSSRLFNEVRVKRGLAYFVKADLDLYQDVGSYSIRAGVDKNKVLETLEVIATELHRVKKYGVSSSELKRAQDYFQGTMLLSLEDPSLLASWYAKQALFSLEKITPAQRIKKIKKVKAEEIQDLANHFFQKSKINLALIGPFQNPKPFLRVLENKV
ncbi:insulinase family protein [Patescibacteria group bacterium]|nr:insulinase family protein [Patescibacteria group bacterium]